MANSFVRYTGDGSTTAYAIPFSYRVVADITVLVAGVATTAFTYNGAGTQITFTSAPANLAKIEIRRTTSQATKLVDYASGSVLTESDLDTDSDQAFYMAQEAIDDSGDVIKTSGSTFQWDAQTLKIQNVVDPALAQEVATKNYVDTASTSQVNAAAASAAAALVSENAAAADLVLTNADVVLAEADKVQTGLDRVATAADVVLTAADVVLTAADVVTTAGDRSAIATIYDTFDDRYLGTKSSDPTLDNDGAALLTGAMYFNSAVNNTRFYNGSTWEDPEATATSGANTATTKANEAAASAAAALVSENAVAADEVLTNADTVLTAADVVLTHADVVLAEADKVQTGLDRVATAADVVLTNADVVLTTADEVLTNADTILTAADVVLTHADVVLTHADVVSTAASLDAFDDTYLGSKSSDPSEDNDGDDLVAGALYFNSSANQIKYWTGSSWTGIGVNTDIQAKVSANDTTAGYLNGKIVGGTAITLAEGSDGGDETLTINAVAAAYPTITSISPSVALSSTATTIVVTGTNYVLTPNVEIINSSGAISYPLTVVRNSATQLTITVNISTKASYYLRVENPDGLSARSSSALLTVSDAPTFSTSSGSLGEGDKAAAMSFDVDGSSDSTVAFSLLSGALPTGLSLNTVTGVLSGTESSSITETTVYNFTLRLTDAESQTADRAFSISVSIGMANSGQFN